LSASGHEAGAILGNQLLRSGTSIGANVEEALAGQSRRDFAAKMAIARKEARECNYWLRLLRDAVIVETTQLAPMLEKSVRLIRILTATVKGAQAPPGCSDDGIQHP